jgi:hypothetical protein
MLDDIPCTRGLLPQLAADNLADLLHRIVHFLLLGIVPLRVDKQEMIRSLNPDDTVVAVWTA